MKAQEIEVESTEMDEEDEITFIDELSCFWAWFSKFLDIFMALLAVVFSLLSLLFTILSCIFYPLLLLFQYCPSILDWPCFSCGYNCYRDYWPFCSCCCVDSEINEHECYRFGGIHTKVVKSTKLTTCIVWPIPTDINDLNFTYLIIDFETEKAAVVDPGNPQQVYDVLHTFGLDLSMILITHGHHDHALGISPLLKRFPEARVYGSDLDNVPGRTDIVSEGDIIKIGATSVHVYDVPYHTIGHVLFTINHGEAAFTGDALFGGTIGNPFESRPDLVATLAKMRSILPPDCFLFVGHDVLHYSMRFSAWLNDENKAVLSRLHQADRLRAQNHTTIPYRMSVELETNPYFMIEDQSFVKLLMDKMDVIDKPSTADDVISLLRQAMSKYASRAKQMKQKRYVNDWRTAERLIFDGWVLQIGETDSERAQLLNDPSIV